MLVKWGLHLPNSHWLKYGTKFVSIWSAKVKKSGFFISKFNFPCQISHQVIGMTLHITKNTLYLLHNSQSEISPWEIVLFSHLCHLDPRHLSATKVVQATLLLILISIFKMQFFSKWYIFEFPWYVHEKHSF